MLQYTPANPLLHTPSTFSSSSSNTTAQSPTSHPPTTPAPPAPPTHPTQPTQPSQPRRRITYVIPPPTDPVPRLRLDPGGARLGRTGPGLIPLTSTTPSHTPPRSPYSSSSPNASPRRRTFLSPRGSRDLLYSQQSHRRESHPHPHPEPEPEEPKHRLRVAAFALDTTTQLEGRDAPEGILYTGGRDGLVMAWDLGLPLTSAPLCNSASAGYSSAAAGRRRGTGAGGVPKRKKTTNTNTSAGRGGGGRGNTPFVYGSPRSKGRWERITGWADTTSPLSPSSPSSQNTSEDEEEYTYDYTQTFKQSSDEYDETGRERGEDEGEDGEDLVYGTDGDILGDVSVDYDRTTSMSMRRRRLYSRPSAPSLQPQHGDTHTREEEGDEGDGDKEEGEGGRHWRLDEDKFVSGTPSRFRQCAQMHTDWVNDIVLCNQDQTLISASSDGTVKAWNPHDPEGNDPVLVGRHADYVRCLSACATQPWIASGSFDRTIKLWDVSRSGGGVDDPTPILTLGSPSTSSTTLLPNPSTTSNPSNAPTTSTTAPGGPNSHNLTSDPKQSIYALACAPSGAIIASGSPERVVRLWDPRSGGKRTGRLVGHTDNIRAVVVSRDERYLLTGSADASIKLWSLLTLTCLHTFTHHSDSVWSLYSSHPSLEVFYSGDKEGAVCRVDVRDVTLSGSGDDSSARNRHRSMSETGMEMGGGDVADGECVVLCRDSSGGAAFDSHSNSNSSPSAASASASRAKAGDRQGTEGVNRIVVLDDRLVWTAAGGSSVCRWEVPRTTRGGGGGGGGGGGLDAMRSGIPLGSRDEPNASAHALGSGSGADVAASSSSTAGGDVGPQTVPAPAASNIVPIRSRIPLVSTSDSFTGQSVRNPGSIKATARSTMSRRSSMSYHAHGGHPDPTRSSSHDSTFPPDAQPESELEPEIPPTETSLARPFLRTPEYVIKGSEHGLVRAVLLNDRLHAVSVDGVGEVRVWDVVRCRCLGVVEYGRTEASLSQPTDHKDNHTHTPPSHSHSCALPYTSPRETLESLIPLIQGQAVVAPWCTVSTKMGVLSVTIEERGWADAEGYCDELGFVDRRASVLPAAESASASGSSGNGEKGEGEVDKRYDSDMRLNLGKWVLRNLFMNFVREEMRARSSSHSHSHSGSHQPPHVARTSSSGVHHARSQSGSSLASMTSSTRRDGLGDGAGGMGLRRMESGGSFNAEQAHLAHTSTQQQQPQHKQSTASIRRGNPPTHIDVSSSASHPSQNRRRSTIVISSPTLLPAIPPTPMAHSKITGAMTPRSSTSPLIAPLVPLSVLTGSANQGDTNTEVLTPVPPGVNTGLGRSLSKRTRAGTLGDSGRIQSLGQAGEAGGLVGAPALGATTSLPLSGTTAAAGTTSDASGGGGGYFSSRAKQISELGSNVTFAPTPAADESNHGQHQSITTPSVVVPVTPVTPGVQSPVTPGGGLMGKLKMFGKSSGAKKGGAAALAAVSPSAGSQATDGLVSPSVPPVTTPGDDKTPQPTPSVQTSLTPLQTLLSQPLAPPSSVDAPTTPLSPNISILISEESSASPSWGSFSTTYRGAVGTVGKERKAVEERLPTWALEWLLWGKVGVVAVVKMGFVLVPWGKEGDEERLPELLNTAHSKLTASRYLRVRKVASHVQDKLDSLLNPPQPRSQATSPRTSHDAPRPPAAITSSNTTPPGPTTPTSFTASATDPNKPRAEDMYEILCNDVVLPWDMTLAVVRQFVWKQSGELVLQYRRKMSGAGGRGVSTGVQGVGEDDGGAGAGAGAGGIGNGVEMGVAL